MDERLRAADREARQGGDAKASRSLARALEQAGDAVGAWRVRSALARHGDDEAWEALHALPAGVREGVIARRRTFGGEARIVGAFGRRLFVNAEGGLRVLDADQLTDEATIQAQGAGRSFVHAASRWSGPGWTALVGPRLVHWNGGDLTVRDAIRGEVLARVALSPERPWFDLIFCGASADRLLVRGEDEPRGHPATERCAEVLLDLGERVGEVIHSTVGFADQDRSTTLMGGLRIAREHRGEVASCVTVAGELDEGALRWRTAGDPRIGDHAHVFVQREEGGTQLRRGRDSLVAIDALTGAERWTAPGLSGLHHALAREILTVDGSDPGGMAVRGIDRATGRVVWSAPPEDLDLLAGISLCAARDVVYVSRRSRSAAGSQVIPRDLRVFDLATGAVLWSTTLCPQDARASSHLPLLALDHALVVAVPQGEDTELIRFEPRT